MSWFGDVSFKSHRDTSNSFQQYQQTAHFVYVSNPIGILQI